MTDDVLKLASSLKMAIVAEAMCNGTTPDLTNDDTLIYAGSATWEDWENHVPAIVRSVWPHLSMQARLAVFITAKQFTTYKAGGGDS